MGAPEAIASFLGIPTSLLTIIKCQCHVPYALTCDQRIYILNLQLFGQLYFRRIEIKLLSQKTALRWAGLFGLTEVTLWLDRPVHNPTGLTLPMSRSTSTTPNAVCVLWDAMIHSLFSFRWEQTVVKPLDGLLTRATHEILGRFMRHTLYIYTHTKEPLDLCAVRYIYWYYDMISVSYWQAVYCCTVSSYHRHQNFRQSDRFSCFQQQSYSYEIIHTILNISTMV